MRCGHWRLSARILASVLATADRRSAHPRRLESTRSLVTISAASACHPHAGSPVAADRQCRCFSVERLVHAAGLQLARRASNRCLIATARHPRHRDAGRHQPLWRRVRRLADGADGACLRLVRVAADARQGDPGRGGRDQIPGAMAVGDELSVYVELVKQGRTSLRLQGRSDRARAGRRRPRRIVAEGEFTFVAAGRSGQAAGDRQ